MSAHPERGRYDLIGEPITGMAVCWDCAAVVPADHRATHDAAHDREALIEQVIDVLMGVAVEVFHGDAGLLHDRMSASGQEILARWAAHREGAF